jgi:hypothetical protein
LNRCPATAFRAGTALARASFPGQAVFRRKFMATATQKKKVHKVMHEHKKGTLKSGSGKKVRSRKQAVAIAMSESGQSRR